MKFKLVENRVFFDDIIKKKSKKDPTKGARGWFTDFMPDKEKGMEVLNKNLENNTDSAESAEVSSETSNGATGTGDAGNC